MLEWAQGDDGGDFSVLEGQCYSVWICRRENVHHFHKKKSKSAVRRKRRITHLEPDILECEVKWALESITTNKASAGDGIPVELFQMML